MKKLVFLFAIIFYQFASAQKSVGIGPYTPNASAALDINTPNKGLLLPYVQLQSTVDNITIPSPAEFLMINNYNSNLPGGRGIFYNAGTAASPNWTRVGDLVLPYYKATSDAGYAFNIENYSPSASSSAIKCYSAGGNSLEVSGKIKIAGAGQLPQQGKILTSDANGNATWEGAVAFSATGIKSGASAVIPASTIVKIPFWNEKYDLGNDYNNSEVSPHSSFTAPVHGIYHFDVGIIWFANDIDGYVAYLDLKMLYNGVTSSIVNVRNNFPALVYLPQSISTDIELQAGAQVFVTVNHNVTNTSVILETSASDAHFNGMLKIKL